MADRSGLAPMSNKAHISQPRCLTIRFPSSDPATLLLRTGVSCSVGVRDAAWTREPQVRWAARSLQMSSSPGHSALLLPVAINCNSRPHQPPRSASQSPTRWREMVLLPGALGRPQTFPWLFTSQVLRMPHTTRPSWGSFSGKQNPSSLLNPKKKKQTRVSASHCRYVWISDGWRSY